MINYTSDDDNRHDPAKAEALETEAALRVIYEAHPEYNPKYERDALVREVALRKHILEQEKEIEKLMVGLEVEKEEVRRRDGWVRDMQEAMEVVTNVLVKQIGDLVEAQAELAKAREDAARLCAEAYQVIGTLALECERGEDVVKVLSNLSARKIVYQDVLPFAAREEAEN